MSGSQRHHVKLLEIARQAMIDRGFLPEFSSEVRDEVRTIQTETSRDQENVRDMRSLLWCSIDNDDSRDLDQLNFAERLEGEAIRIYVAVADVDARVKKGGPIDQHAQHNTTSVYTPAWIFAMLPEELSTELTSLNEAEERLAIVITMTVESDGSVTGSSVERALVFNHAKLAYDSVGGWLEGESGVPEKVASNESLESALRVQDEAAQRLRLFRFTQGALDLDTIEARAVMKDGEVVDLIDTKKNRARQLIEDFMVSANGVTARFLDERELPSFRRIVRTPERWDRIVALAEQQGEKLPPSPDSAALEEFLLRRRKADPMRFPDLSLSIVKLLGSGEYEVEYPGREGSGHFGLAVRDYSHSTAPNRRFPDLITQRLLKAALASRKMPYSNDELEFLAQHCTEREDEANKVERLVRKAAGALLLESRINDRFEGIVTGASEKGTWVRIFHPPVEGKVVHGWEGVDVGDKIRVKLIHVDPERGYIDFVRTKR